MAGKAHVMSLNWNRSALHTFRIRFLSNCVHLSQIHHNCSNLIYCLHVEDIYTKCMFILLQECPISTQFSNWTYFCVNFNTHQFGLSWMNQNCGCVIIVVHEYFRLYSETFDYSKWIKFVFFFTILTAFCVGGFENIVAPLCLRMRIFFLNSSLKYKAWLFLAYKY